MCLCGKHDPLISTMLCMYNSASMWLFCLLLAMFSPLAARGRVSESYVRVQDLRDGTRIVIMMEGNGQDDVGQLELLKQLHCNNQPPGQV